MKLTEPERLLVAQIVNIRLESATLKEHIMMEKIYNVMEIEEVKIPVPPDYIDPEHSGLFEQYDGMQISAIENEEHKKILQEAINKARADEMKFWENASEATEEIELDKTQIDVLKDFYEKDKRPFPREYHKVIIDLYGKIS